MTPAWLEELLGRKKTMIPTIGFDQFQSVCDEIEKGRIKTYKLHWDYKKSGANNSHYRFEVYYPRPKQVELISPVSPF